MPVACNHHPSAVVPLRFSFPCRLCEPPLSDRANVDVVKPPVTASSVINNRFVWNVANPLARIRVESLLAVSPGGVSAATADIVTCAPTGTAWMAPFSPPNCSTEVGHGEQKHVCRRSAFGARLGGRGKPRFECGRSAHISKPHCDLLWCRRICRLRHAPQSKQIFHALPVSIDATPCRHYCAACMSGRALDFSL